MGVPWKADAVAVVVRIRVSDEEAVGAEPTTEGIVELVKNEPQ